MTIETSPDDQLAPKGAQTLLHGLAVLRAVADGARDLPTIQQRLGLPKSTVHRLVQALRFEGYLRDTSAGISLGATLIELGFRSLGDNPIAHVAAPVLDALSKQVLDTVHLAVEDHSTVLYLTKIPGRRGAEMRSQVGYRMPLTRTGIGKAMLIGAPQRWAAQWAVERTEGDDEAAERDFLAKMKHYRSHGFAYDLEENEPGIRCVAAPIKDASGAVIGAVSVSATAPYMPSDRMAQLVPTVKGAAAMISREMGYRTWESLPTAT